jgi:hypothetical protein
MMERFFTPGHRIQRKTLLPNGMGGFTESWQDHLTIDGFKRTLAGSERLSADKVTLFASDRFYCNPADITEMDRYISPDGKVYNIKLPDNKMGKLMHIDLEYTGGMLE